MAPEQADGIWTVKRTMDWCVSYLERHDDEHPRRSAEWLMSAATGLSRVELYAFFDRPLSMDERDELRESLKRRAAGEPLQYVTGEVGFRHIVLRTAKGVLIPRPETEVLVQEVLDECAGKEGVKVLEVGCGTGCIALSLAHEAKMEVTATDISDDAIAAAARNVEALGLEEQVHLVKTDCVCGVEGSFDVLVSNPPYIPTALLDKLSPEVTAFEPALALDGGADGLDFFDRLVNEAAPLLNRGGLIALELHEDCLEEAASRLEGAGFSQVRIVYDLAGKPRVLLGRKN